MEKWQEKLIQKVDFKNFNENKDKIKEAFIKICEPLLKYSEKEKEEKTFKKYDLELNIEPKLKKQSSKIIQILLTIEDEELLLTFCEGGRTEKFTRFKINEQESFGVFEVGREKLGKGGIITKEFKKFGDYQVSKYFNNYEQILNILIEELLKDWLIK